MNVADPPLNGIALFAGAGMLDEGLRAGLAHLGIRSRIVCYVEREAYACGVLAARMEEGSLAVAPLWSDVTTFDGRRWRGCVDFIAGGFPCQDISIAGRRAGLDGERSSLFYEILDIADDSGAWCLFLENVGGIASATATVMDEAGGELLERAAARVLGELADRGWDAEWITLSASDVGASHGRKRWFCLAWRVADPSSPRRQWREFSGTRNSRGGGQEAHGSTSELRGLFAPRPADPRWPGILAVSPGLAPALEPGFRGVVDGVETELDGNRAARLRIGGNGVVALQAAVGFVDLARRAGFMKAQRTEPVAEAVA